MGLKLNVTSQPLDWEDDANLMGDFRDNLQKNTEAEAKMEAGLEVNAQKTKRALLFCHQCAEKNHDIKTINK